MLNKPVEPDPKAYVTFLYSARRSQSVVVTVMSLVPVSVPSWTFAVKLVSLNFGGQSLMSSTVMCTLIGRKNMHEYYQFTVDIYMYIIKVSCSQVSMKYNLVR